MVDLVELSGHFFLKETAQSAGVDGSKTEKRKINEGWKEDAQTELELDASAAVATVCDHWHEPDNTFIPFSSLLLYKLFLDSSTLG
jgi:hypothetical protein